MNSRTSTQISSADRWIASLFTAGVMFVLGYSVIRTALIRAESSFDTLPASNAEVVVPHEGTLWADFGKTY